CARLGRWYCRSRRQLWRWSATRRWVIGTWQRPCSRTDGHGWSGASPRGANARPHLTEARGLLEPAGSGNSVNAQCVGKPGLGGRYRVQIASRRAAKQRRPSVLPRPARKPRRDLLEQPAVAVRIAEGVLVERGA